MYDVVIVGAGPVGLACAIEAKREGLTALVIDKGALVNSLVGYPARMEFFSTPELIEIGGYPFPVQGYKPSREDAIEYTAAWRRRKSWTSGSTSGSSAWAGCRRLHADDGPQRAPRASRRRLHRLLRSAQPARRAAARICPKVTHYYREPYPYVRQQVAVIGARNSAAKAALDCYRHGSEVTLVVRAPVLSDKIKYWIKPDLENRIKEGSIKAYFNTSVSSIEPVSITLSTTDGDVRVPNQWVLAMTGYHPDYTFLESRSGLRLTTIASGRRSSTRPPSRPSRPGVYLAGTVCGGYATGRWFIENGRFHAQQIARHIAHGSHVRVPFERIHWKTEE